MAKKEKVENSEFKAMIRELSDLIDNLNIVVKEHSEGASLEKSYSGFLTNKGKISFVTIYDEKGFEKFYSIRFNDKVATIKLNKTDIEYNESERSFEDLKEDLKSIFYDTHVEKDEIEYDDMSE